MFKNMRSSLPVFLQLLYSDFLVFKPSYKGRLFDFFLYVAITVFVMGRLLTKLGMHKGFGMFTAATCVAAAGMFEIYPRAAVLVADITGNRVISYDTTLPIPSWLAVARVGISDALRIITLSIFAFPFALPFVWNEFDLALFSPFWFLALLFSSAMLFGFFGVALATMVPDMNQLEPMWVRVIFPLWTLGCFQFTWHVLHEAYPWLAYLMLLNPFVYPMEGMRAVILGQAGSLPMWLCFAMTVFFTIVCGWIGVRGIMRRLDAV